MSKCTNVSIEQIQKMNQKSSLKAAIWYIAVFLLVLALVIFLNLNQAPKNKKAHFPFPVYKIICLE